LAAAASLDAFSERGRVVPEWNQPSVRELLVQRYRLLYEVTLDEVHILAFLHGARDLTRLRLKVDGFHANSAMNQTAASRCSTAAGDHEHSVALSFAPLAGIPLSD